MKKYIHTALKGTLTALLLMVGVSTWAEEPETNVAQIGENKYTTLQKAIDAATESPTTIELIANVSEEAITIPDKKSVNLVGGEYTVSGTITSNGTLTIVSGTFTNTTDDALKTDGQGSITISGGTFSTVVENFGKYLQRGYAVKANSGEPTTYSVVPQTSTTVNQSITGTDKNAADALAANTATTTTSGLAYNQSLAISIENVTMDNGVVKTATFNVTPKDVDGNTIENWSGEVTFRLPVSSSILVGKWANLKHGEEAITGAAVQEYDGNKFIEITTSSFSLYSYDIINNPVAQIGETKYESVNAAIADENTTTATITLLANDVTAINVADGKNITLTIGTYTLSGAITNAGTLAISDGTISGNITNTGILNISGGAIEGTITKTAGTISITGGTFTNKPDAEWIAQGHEVMVGAEGKYVVAATGIAEAQIGEVKYQTIALAIAAVSTEAEAEATTIIVLKDITNDFTIEEGQKIALSVASHTISGNISNAGTLAIADGTLTGTITNSGTLNISGGTFEGTVTNSGTQLYITGGTFYSKPSNYTCEAGHELVLNNESRYVVVLTSETEAQIESEKYLTIGKAIEVAGLSATTITLLKDPTSTPTIEIPAGATITLAISNGLSKPIANSGALTIENGSTTGNLTIMTAKATITIKDGVTHNGVQLDGSLGDYVLKTFTNSGSKLYKAVLKYSIQVDNGITDSDQRTAANALAGNDQLPIGLDGLEVNQSIAVTITAVTLTDGNVTSATFNVVLSGANGTAITTASNDITFRLPVSTGIDAGKWVNIRNASAPIPGATVQAGKYIEITTTNFSNNSPNFSYTILAEEPIAQIGKTKYESVTAAITAATSAQPIVILKDINDDITVADSKTITLAGGEHTLSGTITNRGALTLASGTFNGAITSTAGTITINGGSFSNNLTTNGGTIAITGGTFTGSYTFTETTDGITISGGTFDNLPDVGVCATDYVPVKNGEGKFNMTNNWQMTDETAIESINYYDSHGYTVATATYTRSVGMVGVGGNPDGTKYGTICLPFKITAKPTGVENLYTATSIVDNTLTITEVSSYPVEAGTPLIFELSAVNKEMKIVSTNATINTANITAPTDGNLLRGTYTEQNYNTELTSKYYLNGDKFHQAVQSLKVPAYRAYIHYVAPSPAKAPSFLNICKDGNENQTTGISAVEAFEGVTEVYDLNGRKQSGLQRGINIMRRADGSTLKVIVK